MARYFECTVESKQRSINVVLKIERIDGFDKVDVLIKPCDEELASELIDDDVVKKIYTDINNHLESLKSLSLNQSL